MATSRPGAATAAGRAALTAWRAFCRFLVGAFYRRCEVQGAERVPRAGPLIVCGNHASALADAVILQAASPRPLHPLARSGLFSNPLLRLALAAQGAVPVYRPQDGADTSRNQESFVRCHERLAAGEALLIFPEGQSHSDPTLRPLKTGAARIALGAQAAGGPAAPALLPAGLTFTQRGKFRSSVLVQFGTPIDSRPLLGEDGEDAARRLTAEVQRGLAAVTLNADAWEDVALIRAVERFFALRGGRGRRASLGERLRVQQRLGEGLRALRLSAPEHVTRLRRMLERFERLLDRFGVEDYHLDLRYTRSLVSFFVVRSLFYVLLVFPLAIWGLLTSGLPFYAIRYFGRWLSRGRDQYDSAKMLLGLFLVPATWTVETWWVWQRWGSGPAALFAAVLPVTAAIALAVRHERRRIWENARVLLTLRRKEEVRALLVEKRAEIERELARLARLSRRATAPAAGR